MDWPYDETETPIAEPNAPDWECPEGICECHHPDETGEKYEFSVMLFSPEGERMKGARCRILHHGRVMNESQPNADGSGWVTATVPHLPATVLVEWAPADMPRKPPYPFRKWYYVDLERTTNEAARRRLHNLGYSTRASLVENVKHFQRDQRVEHPSGKVEDIEQDLLDHHDDGMVPYCPLDRRGGGQKGEEASPGQRGAKATPDDDYVGDTAPGKPKPAAKPPTTGATVISRGSAMLPLTFPPVDQVLRADEGLYEFVPIFVKGKSPKNDDIEGIFWIFSDALMWKVPNTDEWKNWTKSSSPLPIKPRIGTLTDVERERLCRLPCDPLQSQRAADWVVMPQKELLATIENSSTYPAPTTEDPAPSLLPTPNLYDQLYLQASVRFKYIHVVGLAKGEPKRSLPEMSNEYNDRFNQALRDAVSKSSGKPLRSVGTPGKIWAAHEDMERWQWDNEGHFWYLCAINYGFHQGEATPSVEQTPGSRHNTAHIDYSQILVLVAGWCLLKGGKNEKTGYKWKYTVEAYTSDEYAPLVNRRKQPLLRCFYQGNERDSKPATNGPKWTPQQ
jgi:hypothetical protein